MRVKLLKDRVVGHNQTPKVYIRTGHGDALEAREGTVLEVSEATGAKWIKDGKAQATTEPLTARNRLTVDDATKAAAQKAPAAK